jgi:hypothetical protein
MRMNIAVELLNFCDTAWKQVRRGIKTKLYNSAIDVECYEYLQQSLPQGMHI